MNILIAGRSIVSTDMMLQKSVAFFGNQHAFQLSSNLFEAKRFLKQHRINYLVAELQAKAHEPKQSQFKQPILTAIQLAENVKKHVNFNQQSSENPQIILIKKPFTKAEISVALQNLFTPKTALSKPKLNRFMLPIENGIRFVKLSDIIRVEAKGDQSIFYLIDNSRITVNNQINSYEKILPIDCFLRTHKSHLINIFYLKKYIRTGGLHIVLEDNAKIPVSADKKTILENAFKACCGAY